MSIIKKYINTNIANTCDIYNKLNIQQNVQIMEYTNIFENNYNNPTMTSEYLKNQIENYILKNHEKINVHQADINFYIERINFFVWNKFSDVMKDIGINFVLELCDYGTMKNENYLKWRTYYYECIYKYMLYGKFIPFDTNVGELNLFDLIVNFWSLISFDNIMDLVNTLNKIKYFSFPVDDYIKMIIEKLENSQDIVKLLNFINEGFNNFDSEANNDCELYDLKMTHSRFNIRFIIDNLKSNGYLLFEEYKKYFLNKYKKSQKIETIINDIKLVKYFMYIISKKDSNATNRQVNELLINMQNYLYDIEDSWNCNKGYQLINIIQKSDKYKLMDLSNLDRTKAHFNILRYSYVEQNQLIEFKLTESIEPYFDIFKAFYKSRFPDRDIEFNPITSTLIIKVSFYDKPYYIHLALIQYIVLDLIYKAPSESGISVKKIFDLTKISEKYLLDTLNSLIKIKLIKRTNIDFDSISNSISNSNSNSNYDFNPLNLIKFYINWDFTHENNKFSIAGLLPKNIVQDNIETNKEFLHDRTTIVLANVYDYIKKIKHFNKTILYENIKNNIPFEITLKDIDEIINVLKSKTHINESTSTGDFYYC